MASHLTRTRAGAHAPPAQQGLPRRAPTRRCQHATVLLVCRHPYHAARCGGGTRVTNTQNENKKCAQAVPGWVLFFEGLHREAPRAQRGGVRLKPAQRAVVALRGVCREGGRGECMAAAWLCGGWGGGQPGALPPRSCCRWPVPRCTRPPPPPPCNSAHPAHRPARPAGRCACPLKPRGPGRWRRHSTASC